MKKHLPTVSIGIPAYNEGKNIQALLQTLLRQKQEGFHLSEIIVVSDGSSDDTVQQIKSIKHNAIRLVNNSKRQGKSVRLNQIFRKFTSDILVLMDADVMIKDRRLIAKAVRYADITKSGIAGINAIPFASDYFFEQTLETGVEITKSIAVRWNNGNNYLAFRGCFLMLDGALARTIRMPQTLVNNDSYLYFSAKANGYHPAYLPSCEIHYRSPSTMNDHVKQSSRFKTSKHELGRHFNLNIDKEYKLPLAIVTLSVLQFMFKRPIHTVSYLGVNLFSSLKKQSDITSTWSIASSTK